MMRFFHSLRKFVGFNRIIKVILDTSKNLQVFAYHIRDFYLLLLRYLAVLEVLFFELRVLVSFDAPIQLFVALKVHFELIPSVQKFFFALLLETFIKK